MENTETNEVAAPAFLQSIVTPLDDRVEMGRLGKMCSCFSYGS